MAKGPGPDRLGFALGGSGVVGSGGELELRDMTVTEGGRRISLSRISNGMRPSLQKQSP